MRIEVIYQALHGLQELDLKVRQFEMLLKQPPALQAAPNLNILWARLMVEELCRLGASTFCIAPGKSLSHSLHRVVPFFPIISVHERGL